MEDKISICSDPKFDDRITVNHQIFEILSALKCVCSVMILDVKGASVDGRRKGILSALGIDF